MKLFLTLLLFPFYTIVNAQQIDSVKIPPGVVYKYSSPDVLEKAKKLIIKDITDTTSYELGGGTMFIGPSLWSRYKLITLIRSIPGGGISIKFNNEILTAKMTQDADGYKKVWDRFRIEALATPYKIRKATFAELQYYWAVISFDIEEPLLIVETDDHRFILNISPQKLKLLWLDEVPPSVK